jgi:hypothetical protein
MDTSCTAAAGTRFPRAAEGLGPRIEAIALLSALYAGRRVTDRVK